MLYLGSGKGGEDTSPDARLVVLTVDTSPTVGSDNLVKLLNRFGFDEYAVLGRGEKFGGWAWRTAKYTQAVKALLSEHEGYNGSATDVHHYTVEEYLTLGHKRSSPLIVILCDAGDVLAVDTKRTTINKFLSASHETGARVFIGAEQTCCNAVPFLKRNEALRAARREYPDSRHRFPNGGFVIGYARDVLLLLELNQYSQDDQAGYMRFIAEGSHRALFQLDYKSEIIGNMPRYKIFTYPDDHPQVQASDNLQVDWALESDEQGRAIVRRRATGAVPPFLHFPGKNFVEYNAVMRASFPFSIAESSESVADRSPVALI